MGEDEERFPFQEKTSFKRQQQLTLLASILKGKNKAVPRNPALTGDFALCVLGSGGNSSSRLSRAGDLILRMTMWRSSGSFRSGAEENVPGHRVPPLAGVDAVHAGPG